MSEPARSRHARQLAETALVRIVDAYGAVPEFVLLGGLVPDLLCSQSSTLHIGTTDNFASPGTQGPRAYADTVVDLHLDDDGDLLTNDAVAAIETFMSALADGRTAE